MGWNPENRPDVARFDLGVCGLSLVYVETWGLGMEIDQSMLKMRGICKYND